MSAPGLELGTGMLQLPLPPGAPRCPAWCRGPGGHGAAAGGGPALGRWGAAWPFPASQPLCPAVKPGYCYHNAEVEDLLAENCGSCRTDTSSPHCTGDASCPGATKCCPSKCGYTCQDPVMGEGSLLKRWGSGVAAW